MYVLRYHIRLSFYATNCISQLASYKIEQYCCACRSTALKTEKYITTRNHQTPQLSGATKIHCFSCYKDVPHVGRNLGLDSRRPIQFLHGLKNMYFERKRKESRECKWTTPLEGTKWTSVLNLNL